MYFLIQQFSKMKKNLCAIYALLFFTSISIGQTPIFSLDAAKGFNATTWQDQSGNGNHVSLTSTSKTADGVYFDGNNSAMLTNPIPLSNFTIYMTLKVQELGKTLLGNGQPSEYGLHYQDNALYTATDQPFSVFNSNALIINKNIVIALSRDVTKNGGNTALYIDGALVGTFTANHQKIFNLTNLSGEAPSLFKGWMKSMAIYNTVHDITRIKNISSGIAPSGGQTGNSAGIQGTIEVSDQIHADVLASFRGNRISNVNKEVFSIEVWSVKYENGQKIEGAKRQPVNVLLQNKVTNAKVTTSKVSGAINFTITGAPMDGNHIILAYFNGKPVKYKTGDINGNGDDGSGRTIQEVVYKADVKKKLGADKIWGLYSLRPNTDKNNIVFRARLSDGTETQNMDFWDDVEDFFEDIGDAIIGLAGVVANGASSFVIQVGTATYNLFSEGEEPRHKLLTPEEYKWANDKMFNGTLPSRGSIIVTNLVGIGGRQYTIPNGLGQIYMNMGSGGYQNPTTYVRPNSSEVPGQLLIHELTHAWQIEYNTGLKAMSEGISNQWKSTVADNKDVYKYVCGKKWDEYNFEQQASIVEKCYAKIYMRVPDKDNCELEYVKRNIGRTTYNISANNYNYLSGDFNGDGKTDLIHLVSENYLHVWLKNGSDGFDIKPRFPAQNGYNMKNGANFKFLTGDFNGDGKTDLVHIVDWNYLHVWISNGDGTFDIKNRYPAQNGYSFNNDAGYNITVGDFNGDGKSDLFHVVNGNYAHVLLSKGDGNFDVKNRFPAQNGYDLVGGAKFKFLAGDFNGDGKTDMAHIVNDNYLHIWMSKGDGSFEIKNRYPAQNGYVLNNAAGYHFTVGDFNGDGKSDLFHIINGDYSHTWLSKGDGSFDIKERFPAQNGYNMKNEANYKFLTGDFNGDGKTDLVHIVNNNYSQTWLSKGDGSYDLKARFPAQNGYLLKGDSNFKFIVGNFDGNRNADIIHIVNAGYTHLWLGNGNGTFNIGGQSYP
jgi:hypothetical protein